MLHHLENHIEHMRTKPAHKKRQYAFGISFCVTLVIFGIWLAAKTMDTTVTAKKATAPIQALTANASGAFDYVRDMIFGANKKTYDSDNVEVVPGKI